MSAPLPSKELVFSVGKTDAGRWVCSFVLNEQEHTFTGSDPTEAVSKAVDFLGKENIRSAEIVRV